MLGRNEGFLKAPAEETQFSEMIGESAPQTSPLAQAAQGRSGAQRPSFAPGVLGQRRLFLQAGVPHTEYFRAATMKIIKASVLDLEYAASFDESETFSVFEGQNFAPGFQFSRFVITAPQTVEIVAQFGYAFQG